MAVRMPWPSSSLPVKMRICPLASTSSQALMFGFLLRLYGNSCTMGEGMSMKEVFKLNPIARHPVLFKKFLLFIALPFCGCCPFYCFNDAALGAATAKRPLQPGADVGIARVW